MGFLNTVKHFLGFESEDDYYDDDYYDEEEAEDEENARVRRVSEGIFVAAPKNIDITGDTMKEHVKNGMDWNFM